MNKVTKPPVFIYHRLIFIKLLRRVLTINTWMSGKSSFKPSPLYNYFPSRFILFFFLSINTFVFFPLPPMDARCGFFFFSILQATGRRGRRGGEGGGARSSSSQLSISAVLIGGVGVVGGAVGLLAVLTRRHPLVDPVQAARLLEVADLPRGGEALDGCGTQSRHQGAASARRKRLLTAAPSVAPCAKSGSRGNTTSRLEPLARRQCTAHGTATPRMLCSVRTGSLKDITVTSLVHCCYVVLKFSGRRSL